MKASIKGLDLIFKKIEGEDLPPPAAKKSRFSVRFEMEGDPLGSALGSHNIHRVCGYDDDASAPRQKICSGSRCPRRSLLEPLSCSLLWPAS